MTKHSVEVRQETTLPNFPFLTTPEFRGACESFVAYVKSTKHGDWQNISLVERDDGYQQLVYLTISKTLGTCFKSVDIVATGDDLESCLHNQQQEEDDEVIQPHAQEQPSITYHIILSPIYEVPVLYFFLRGIDSTAKSPVQLVYDVVVSQGYTDQVKKVGVIGAISFGDHPHLGVPALFVHPCNTADALREMSSDMTITVENYLLAWLGIIGGCVGLTAPFGHGGRSANKT